MASRSGEFRETERLLRAGVELANYRTLAGLDSALLVVDAQGLVITTNEGELVLG